jgi:hypothetical protein
MKKLTILLAVSTLTLGGCAWFGGSSASSAASAGGAATKESVTAAIAAAETAVKKANSVGGEWRDTENLIKDAKAALGKGELDSAMKLAKTAEEEAKLGALQAAENKDAKPWLF